MSWGDIPDWAFDTAKSILQMLKLKDPLTYEHCCRVAQHCRKLANFAGLNEYEQSVSEFAGLFHDIGKVGISDSIIHKAGPLDQREFLIMQEHPFYSVESLLPFKAHKFFQDIIPAVQHHHERVDGQGYPYNLMGDHIPLAARVILIVDTYDAMSQNRAYRQGLPDEVIYDEIRRCSGSQFDPQLAKVFLDCHAAHWNLEESELTMRLVA